jgi:hypothetical protein
MFWIYIFVSLMVCSLIVILVALKDSRAANKLDAAEKDKQDAYLKKGGSPKTDLRGATKPARSKPIG